MVAVPVGRCKRQLGEGKARNGTVQTSPLQEL